MERVVFAKDDVIHIVDSHNSDGGSGITGCKEPYYLGGPQIGRRQAFFMPHDMPITCFACMRHWRW